MKVTKTSRISGETFISAALIAATAIFATLIPAASHATTYYAKSLGQLNGATRTGPLTNLVEWCTDQTLTTLADPQPVIAENDGNTYVFAGAIANVKSTHACTFPAGTHVCFGADGDEVGTAASAFSCNSSSASITIPSCTIYGMRLTPNFLYSGQLLGNYRLVKTANAIRFGASSLKDGETYGYELAGTFTGDDDVVIGAYVYSVTSASTVEGTGIARVKFCGDFSGYKGRFETVAFTNPNMTSGHIFVWFSSATSMGDPTSEMDNAVTLRHRGYLRIEEEVEQSATRGITLDLSEGQHAGLIAHSNVRWTLRTPVHGGTTGTLKKVGPGTVVLASAMEATDIVVEEGTLILSNGVSFVEGTTITVANGATLQNLTHGVQNLTVVPEEGGTYECPSDPVPFDGAEAGDPLDFTWLTAADRAALAKPIPIALSQAIAIPFSETNRIAVATFDAAAGFVAEDFTDVSPKQYRYLPVTWFETVTENGVTTLYLVARPAIEHTGGNNLTTADNWSDGKAQHAGADYFSHATGGGMRTSNGSEGSSCSLNGESFTFDNELRNYVRNFYARKLWLYGGSGVRSYHQTNTRTHRIMRGEYHIDPNATLSKPTYVLATDDATNTDFQVTLTGSGTLKIYTLARYHDDTTYGVRPFLMRSDGSAFTGRLYFTTDASNSYFDMYATNGLAFGGPIDTYTEDAVRIEPVTKSGVTATASLTASSNMKVDAENRGWYITTAALGASNDVTFTFSPPTLTLVNKLRKTGGGTLAMGCATIGAGSAFAVEEGYVKALSADCCTNLELAVSSGAGIMVDATPTDPEVAAKGLIAKSILPAVEGGEIAVVLDGGRPEGDLVSVAVCTVPSSQADLSAVLKPKSFAGFKANIVADTETYADEGLVTYRAVWQRIGTQIMVR